MGLALAALSLGYILWVVPAGIVADRMNGLLLLRGVALFSAACMFWLASVSSFSAFCFIRALHGIGLAFGPAATAALVARASSREEAVKIMGINTSAFALGIIVTTPLATYLLDLHGWRFLMRALG